MSDDTGKPKLVKYKPKKEGKAPKTAVPKVARPKIQYVQPENAPEQPAPQQPAPAPSSQAAQPDLIPVDSEAPLPLAPDLSFAMVDHLRVGVIQVNPRGGETIRDALDDYSTTTTEAILASDFARFKIEVRFMSKAGEVVRLAEYDFRDREPPEVPAASVHSPPPGPPRVVKPTRGAGPGPGSRRPVVEVEKFEPGETIIPDGLSDYERALWIVREQERKNAWANLQDLKDMGRSMMITVVEGLTNGANKILSDTGINDRVAMGLREDLSHARLAAATQTMSHTRAMDELYKQIADLRRDMTERNDRLTLERDGYRRQAMELQSQIEQQRSTIPFLDKIMGRFGEEKAMKLIDAAATRYGLDKFMNAAPAAGAGATAGAVGGTVGGTIGAPANGVKA